MCKTHTMLLLIITLIVAWWAGLSIAYLAPLAVAGSLLLPRAKERSLSILPCVTTLLIPLLLLVTAAIQLSRVVRSEQGIDFAIFTQSIFFASKSGVLNTSLLGTTFYNLLTHHFCPILYLPAGLTSLGLSATTAGICVQTAGIAIGVSCLFAIGRIKGCSKLQSALLALALLSLPGVRTPLLWEIHEEIFAVPFIGLGFYHWVKRNYYLSAFFLSLTFLCKEIFPFFILPFVVMALVYAPNKELLKKSAHAYLPLAALALLVILGYFIIFPSYIFQSTFNTNSRIVHWEQFWDFSTLRKKVWAIATFLLPLWCFMLALLRDYKNSRFPFDRYTRVEILKMLFALSIPGVFIAEILVTNFPPTYDSMTYYAFFPSFFLMCVLATQRNARELLSIRALSILIATSFCYGTPYGPTSVVFEAAKYGDIAKEVRPFISPQSVVIAGDNEISSFLSQPQLIRAFHANRNIVNFDIIVERIDKPLRLSRYLRSWSKICFTGDTWRVRCALQKVKPLRTS